MNFDAHSPPSLSKDVKPTLDELEHKAKLIDRSNQSPSSRTTSTLHDYGVDPHGKDSHSAAALAQVITTAFSSALHATMRTTSASVPLPLPPRKPTTTIVDMALCTSPCLSVEMELGHIQVTCTARGTTVEARCKISDQSFMAIEPKFSPMDFSKLISTHTGLLRILGRWYFHSKSCWTNLFLVPTG
jgi:hypothetical protein